MLLKVSKFFLYASVFAVLIVLTSTFFPFIGGKDYFFRASVELGLVALILWWGFEAPAGAMKAMVGDLYKKPLVVAVSIFVSMFLLATLFAYDMNAAFWSNFERGEGGFQMIHYYIFFVLSLLLLKTKEDWRKMFWCFLSAAILMILYGVMSAILVASALPLPWPLNLSFIGPYLNGQGLPSAPTFWGRLFSNVRFQGSLGNPAYVAPYLLFSMFFAAWLWLSKKITAERTALYVGLGIFFFIFLWLSGTRGAFFGFAVAVLAYLLYIAFRQPKLRSWAIGLFAGLVVLGSSIVALHNTNTFKNIPGARLFDVAFSDQTFQTRLWTWGSAWQGFMERPIFGWGPENFTTPFDKYFNPKHFVPGANSETWFDRAHSLVFDYLAETGALGFLSYAGVFFVFYWEFLRNTRQRGTRTSGQAHEPKPILLYALLFVLPIGYVIQGLALFDVLPIYISVFAFLAFASHLFYQAPHEVSFSHASAREIEK